MSISIFHVFFNRAIITVIKNELKRVYFGICMYACMYNITLLPSVNVQYNITLLPSVNIIVRGTFCGAKYTHHTVTPIIKY